MVIKEENSKPGTISWEITDPATKGEIEGYASRTSVNRGEQVQFFVNTEASTYGIEIYRMGWYGGAGARQVFSDAGIAGVVQPPPTLDPVTWFLECHWDRPYTLTIPKSPDRTEWASGIYLAKLTARNSRKQSFIIFVVRDDDRPSDYLYKLSVLTYQAYNGWGGKSFYPFNQIGVDQAPKVSFNRPYWISSVPSASYGVGGGNFLANSIPVTGYEFLAGRKRPSSSAWDYNMVRFLEREGYDVSYCTDVDVHASRSLLLKHKSILSVGHDEYWTREMRDNIEAARDQGRSVGFFSANTCYWQVRLEPGATGEPNRTVVGYKEYYENDPLYKSADPERRKLVTTNWRNDPVNRPEDALIGVMYYSDTDPADSDLVVDDASHWAFEGTGLKNGDVLRGLVGYEVDCMTSPHGVKGNSPPGTVRLGHSDFDYRDSGEIRHSDLTVYRASSGATVFSTGSIQWSWGLDDYKVPPLGDGGTRLNPAAQQITRNVLARFADRRADSVRATATFIKKDKKTKGRWKGKYGADGFNIIDDAESYPSYAEVTASGESEFTWADSTGDVRALQRATGNDLIAGSWFADSGFGIHLSLKDSKAHQLAIYCLDWDKAGREERIDIIDKASGSLLDSQSVSKFKKGVYMVWKITGDVMIQVTYTGRDERGNAVISGLFFGPAS